MTEKTMVTAEKKREYRKNLIKMVEKLGEKYGRHTVWNDFIYMSAAAMSQVMILLSD